MTDRITPETIRSLRRRLGLTQVAFAELIGCTNIAVWMWEHGKRHPTGLYAKAVRTLMELHPAE